MNHSDHIEMVQFFGGGHAGTRVTNALWREDLKSMAEVDRKATQLGEKEFVLFLWCLRTVGELSVARVLDGLSRYRNQDKKEEDMADGITYDVWTRNDSPEWKARNAGCTDMRLVDGVSGKAALTLRMRLGEMYGDGNIEIHPSNEPPKAGTVGINH